MDSDALLKLANNGDAEAQYQLALTCEKLKRRQKWIRAACEGGHLQAYYEIHGRHLEEVVRAAEEGAIDAQGSLGIYYATLRNPDLEKSRHWYLQAALQGSAQAMYEIGLTLLLGEGGEADPQQAIEWLEKAAMTPDWSVEARQVLADAYEHGSNAFPKDPARSEYWRSLPPVSD